MKAKVLVYLFFFLFFCANISEGQAPNLRSVQGFVLFTSEGAVANTAISNITGDIGTNFGAITGFRSGVVFSGDTLSQTERTALVKIDLQKVYDTLFQTTSTISDHAPAFGLDTGEVIKAGVYGIGAAGSITGKVILNAEGNSNAVFIFKFGGAFSITAGAEITLANGALPGNVFWVANGAISMGANSIMIGTFIAKGANSLGNAATLTGRMLSIVGAVNTNTNEINLSTTGGFVPLPVKLLSFSGICNNQNIMLKWSTAVETNNQNFSVERSENAINWSTITTIAGAGNSAIQRNYNYTDIPQKPGNYYYRLKQTDFDGAFIYGNTIYIKNCGEETIEIIKISPNPSTGKFKLIHDNRSQIRLIQVFNAAGEKVFEANGDNSIIDLSTKTAGLYYMRLQTNTNIITKEIIIKKD